jgi:predicted DNA-binding transcriptional regulator AlpA
MIVGTTLDPYLTLRALVAYSGIGLRRLYAFLSDPAHPLPHYRLGGKILVRRSEFDAWIARYRQCGRADVDTIVNGVIQRLNSNLPSIT